MINAQWSILISAAATPSNCKMDACSRLIEDVNYSFPCGVKGGGVQFAQRITKTSQEENKWTRNEEWGTNNIYGWKSANADKSCCSVKYTGNDCCSAVLRAHELGVPARKYAVQVYINNVGNPLINNVNTCFFGWCCAKIAKTSFLSPVFD